MNEEKKETRSERLHLLLTPSLHRDIQTLAMIENTSKNDLLNEIVEIYIEKHKDEINAKKEMLALNNKIMNNIGKMTLEEQQSLMKRMEELQGILAKK